MYRIAIIILNWNGAADTVECLHSIEKTADPGCMIYVVDNGSTDGSADKIRGLFPAVRVIETGKNLGFAEGNNVGIREALKDQADYIFLLNNDTIIDTCLFSSCMAAAAKYTDAGVFGAKVYYYAQPDKIWFAGGVWDNRVNGFLHVGKDMADTYHEIREIDYATGCALMFRREVAEKIGLLDADFFLTYEETDWCYRARRAGFKVLFVPQAKVWHKVSVSFGGDASPLYAYYDSRNRLLWAKKNLSFARRLPVYKSTFKQAMSLGSSESERLVKSARMRGIRDFIFARNGECPASIYALNREYASLKEPR